jgi:hypothetical protein
MRDVTIYGITAHQALAGSFVDMYRMPPIDRLFPIGGGEALMLERETVQRLQLQVHSIHRIGQRDEYIAIEPELEALLMLPITARLTEAERRMQRHANEAARLRQRLDAYNAMPWYRRVWTTIWRDV